MAAILSPCGRYRFELRRQVSAMNAGTVCWVMFNPSTADAEANDPTIRRCIDFTRRWAYGDLVVVNLYPLRSPKPIDALRLYADVPIGGEYFENMGYVERAVQGADEVIAAWGSHGERGTGDYWRERLSELRDDVKCLGWTAGQQPRHPLYVRRDTERVPLTPADATQSKENDHE